MDKPMICFPVHDLNGRILNLLEKITPDLKKYFSKTIISFSPQTLKVQEGRLKTFSADTFFHLSPTEDGFQIGNQMFSLFDTAVKNYPASELLHICASDRLIFALLTKHKTTFLKDVKWAQNQKNSIIFTRSKKAWNTHPKNYYAIEGMISYVGETLFGKRIDFCWCHGTIRIGLLKKILPKIKSSDWTIVCKYALELKDLLISKDVNWLSWEDPFILNKDPKELKKQRENDTKEVEKRLSYAIPMIKTILDYQ